MAFFSRKNKEEKETAKTAVASVTKKGKTALATDYDPGQIIVGSKVTEKSVNLGSNHIYTFVVSRQATKATISSAVKALYGVSPIKVNIVNKRPNVRLAGSKNRLVKVAGEKKAYVYLKKGDTINLV